MNADGLGCSGAGWHTSLWIERKRRAAGIFQRPQTPSLTLHAFSSLQCEVWNGERSRKQTLVTRKSHPLIATHVSARLVTLPADLARKRGATALLTSSMDLARTGNSPDWIALFGLLRSTCSTGAQNTDAILDTAVTSASWTRQNEGSIKLHVDEVSYEWTPLGGSGDRGDLEKLDCCPNPVSLGWLFLGVCNCTQSKKISHC